MKTTCATLLSLLLVLAQVFLLPANAVAATQSGHAAQVSAESCCNGPRAHSCSCCVDRSESRPAQSAAIPAPANPSPLSAGPLSAILTALWSLPAPPACVLAKAADGSPTTPVSVPLFLRHGALLI